MRTLEGKRVVLGITGSIAAVECVKIVHALRRRGASVVGVMSGAACGIMHPDAITYACGAPSITRISGMVEHVRHCGEGGEADLLLIAPCTANTLCKIAAGIDDTPVTTFATTAIGRGMPVILVPAMHHSMYRHPKVREALAALPAWGITLVPPRIEEGKAKIARLDEIVLHAERACMDRPLAGTRVLVTAGPCAEPVDDVRVLTTRSSGLMGREIALGAFRLGAEVTVVHAGEPVPCVENVATSSANEMRDAVHRLLAKRAFDFYVSAAAVSDFAPERVKGKIPSGEPVTLTLQPLPKIIDEVIGRGGPRVAAFKLGRDEEAAAEALLAKGAACVVMNTPDVLGAGEGDFVILTRSSRREVSGSKEEVAAALWSALR
ncbi:MAG: bifunctional phosphopantothenoylcysteine decarboxylase/phosphopantothenate--cysteine ligase CoaBC [Methanomicrobiaceae archaeon]|nr:bifunctional phosphopantothenoylcysteine decarboxylase/phosphopantothenate--cysteine ligase CoaBC [Methanomicrobiaceae archaeon]